ncbi:MAG TPA: sulfotransferase family protein [Mycobacterium sp.]|nr:sulfotransferase family protein [Mycobacterium sp.]
MTASSGLTQVEPRTRHPVFVHIGEAKTGTTYLQNLLDTNRDRLRADGTLYPDCGGSGHVHATLDLRRTTFKGTPDPKIAGSWKRLVDQVRAWNGPALVSCELLAPAAPRHIKRLMDSLDFADVHVIFTVRDMARQLPAAWQERIKNRGQEPFADWLAAIHDPGEAPTSAGRLFWGLHDVEKILAKWSADLPPERVHVVTVPPSGGDPTLLWKRFAQILAVDPDHYRQPEKSVNSSLGAAEVSVVRQVNIALGGDQFPWPAYDRLMKWYLSPKLATRRGVPIDLPATEYEWATAQSQRFAKSIAGAGYDVVGDLGELTPSARPTGIDPDHVPGDLLADAGIAGVATLVQLLAFGDDKHEMPRLRARLAEAEATVSEHRDLPPLERIKRCLVELSAQVRWLGVARRGYTKLRRRTGTARGAG